MPSVLSASLTVRTMKKAAAAAVKASEERKENRGRSSPPPCEEMRWAADSVERTGKKTKVVVVMGATGSGKSRLAIDLAAHFPVEVVNADSMQVYRGLDVLSNKVSFDDRRGVPHHLLGIVDASVDFTSKDFRGLAIPIIEDISSRGCLPVVVGGTNYYIQALVSPFLIDDLIEDTEECSWNFSGESLQQKFKQDPGKNNSNAAFDRLKEIDPAAAKRLHPNDHRKINQYLRLYESSGSIPSELFQGKASERWGRPDNFRYDCCFIWVDAALPALDRYVEQRADSMIASGLLNEVCEIYDLNADYTRGLRQAIGVREFGKFFGSYLFNAEIGNQFTEDLVDGCPVKGTFLMSNYKDSQLLKVNLQRILDSDDGNVKLLLNEATNELKVNTCRLIRRQRRRLNRLKTIFGWNLQYIDATEAFERKSEDSWQREVVDPCVSLVNSFLSRGPTSLMNPDGNDAITQSLVSRDLWAQYICEACGNRILRGAHEWDQHKKGRRHRKRVQRCKKTANSFLTDENARIMELTTCDNLPSL